MRKKIIGAVLAAALLCSALAFAAGEVSVQLNGAPLQFDPNDVQPVIIDDRTMVPMRAVFEALGAEVSWDDSVKTAIGVKDGITIRIAIGSTTMYRNDTPVTLDVPAQLVQERTMVPIRAIAESFNYTVTWDDSTKTVNISSAGLTRKETQSYHGYVTMEERSVSFNGRMLVTSNNTLITTAANKAIYAPLTAVLDCLGLPYAWDAATSTMTITRPESDDDIEAAETTFAPNATRYVPMEYEIYDIVLNASVNGQVFTDLSAVAYGDQIYVNVEDLAEALDLYLFNRTDLYTETMAYYLYQSYQ